MGYFVDQFDRLSSTIEHRQTFQKTRLKCRPYVAGELSQVILTLLLLRNHTDSFSPSRFMNLFRSVYSQFTIGQQHDAQEFISCLLDRLVVHENIFAVIKNALLI